MLYGLLLNDMRSSNIENLTLVKLSEDRQELVDYHQSLLVESYRDGNWGKSFKKDSELEWFNSSSNLEKDNDYFGGIYVGLVEEMKERVGSEVLWKN